MTDKWEVVRHWGDNRQSIISTHKSIELAERAFAKAVESNEFYAVDVAFLVGGNRLDFEPLFGVANGYQYVQHDGRVVYNCERLNNLCEAN